MPLDDRINNINSLVNELVAETILLSKYKSQSKNKMNAEKAKEIALENSNNQNIEKILDKISKEASSGNFALYDIELSNAQIAKLRLLGYKVKLSSDIIKDYKISWR